MCPLPTTISSSRGRLSHAWYCSVVACSKSQQSLKLNRTCPLATTISIRSRERLSHALRMLPLYYSWVIFVILRRKCTRVTMLLSLLPNSRMTHSPKATYLCTLARRIVVAQMIVYSSVFFGFGNTRKKLLLLLTITILALDQHKTSIYNDRPHKE